jgi:ferrous iron transport protein A
VLKKVLAKKSAPADATALPMAPAQCAVANGGTPEQCVCSLDALNRGQKARVCAVAGPNRCRLMELGFTSGTEVEVSRRAAFGGPLEVRLRSYRLSLRRDEAESIRVETTS